MLKRSMVTFIAAGVMAATVMVSPAFADDHLPKPQEIFAKYIEATGGADAYAKVKNTVTNATFSVPDMGMEGTMVTTAAPPHQRATITLDAFGVVDSGVTDGVAWSVNPMEGAKILEGDEGALAVAQAASISPYLDFKGEATTAGEEEVAGEACYKVEIAGVGPVFFSKESGLVVKATSPQGEATLSDYKEVGGIKVPHKTAIASPMATFEITVNSVEHNVDLADDAFAVPTEIEALMPSDGVTKEQVMEMMDTDGDGKITMEEAPEQLKAAFGIVDANGDGNIDVEEAQAIADFMNQ